ncbi:ABC transporter substrate-binding protein [Pectobacterium brasiliense]|uniref:ABC transporter substrate-binding protein n=1 Tax=Pectobacterium brasiliense TaxID=180957 RepID=UPI00057E8DC1|nr:extracellular solute-binding protein [Pectobacterium brasiliense]KHS68549.1 ABC transporter substrate-binding protein [Pectobacterium brasiliense]KHS89668.1 ABC transporter substrate-binding protein [Pectobacterium brasiliense]
MKIKNKVSTLFAVSFLTLGLSSHSLAAEVTVWAWDPNFNVAAMHEASSIYKKADPSFSLKVIDSGKEDIEQKLNTMLASGVKNSLPDIVLIEDYNAQKYLQAYPDSFIPLQDAIDYSQFAPYKTKVMTVGDKVYGVPFDSGVAGMFYRLDYLEAAGYKESDMVNITWDKYIEIGKQVKAKTGVDMLTYDMNDVVLPHIMMQSGGEWFFDNQGQLNLTKNNALKETLKTIKAINDAKIARPISGWSSFVGSFNAGKSASVVSGVWVIGSIKSAEDQKGKWRVAPIPWLNLDKAVHASNQGGSSWYVLKGGKNTKQAIEFLQKTFAADSNMYQTLLVDRGALATFLPATSGPAYAVKDPFFGGQPVFADFSKWVTEIPQVSYGMYTQEVDNAIAAEIPALLKGDSVDDVLKRAEATLKNQIMQ